MASGHRNNNESDNSCQGDFLHFYDGGDTSNYVNGAVVRIFRAWLQPIQSLLETSRNAAVSSSAGRDNDRPARRKIPIYRYRGGLSIEIRRKRLVSPPRTTSSERMATPSPC